MKDTEHHSDDALLMDLLYEESGGGGDGSAIDPQLRKQLTEKYREELEAYREIRAAYRSLEEEDPAPQASAKILREASKVAHATAAPGLVDRFLALFRLPSFGWAGAAAVALLVVGVGVFVSNRAESPDAARARSGDVAEGFPAPSRVPAAGDDEDVAAADGVTAAHGAAAGAADMGKDKAARLDEALARGEAPATGGSEPMAVPSEAHNAGLDGAGMPPPPGSAAAAPAERPADERVALGGDEGRATVDKSPRGKGDAPEGGGDWLRSAAGAKAKGKGSAADVAEDEKSIAFESKEEAARTRDVPTKGEVGKAKDTAPAAPAIVAKSTTPTTPAAPAAPPPAYAKADTAPRATTSAGSSAGYYGSDRGGAGSVGGAGGAGGTGASSGSTYRSRVAQARGWWPWTTTPRPSSGVSPCAPRFRCRRCTSFPPIRPTRSRPGGTPSTPRWR